MLESLQSSTAELQFQLRETADRNSLLSEELADAQRELEYRTHRPSLSTDDTSRIRASIEAKYEARVSELSSRLAEMERDRNDMEAVFSRNLQQKTQEIEVLKRAADASSKNTGISEEEVTELRQQIDSLRLEVATYKEQLSDLDRQKDIINDLEVTFFLHPAFNTMCSNCVFAGPTTETEYPAQCPLGATGAGGHRSQGKRTSSQGSE